MRFIRRHNTNRRLHGRALLCGSVAAIAAIAVTIALGVGAGSALGASTGGVYWNSSKANLSVAQGPPAGAWVDRATGYGNISLDIGFPFQYLTTGYNNASVGGLFQTTTGHENTAFGIGALANNTTGNDNIGIGWHGGVNLTTGSNNIDIGHQGVPGEARTIRIGTAGQQTAAYLAGVYGNTVSGQLVHMDSSGKLGTQPVTAMLNSSSVIDQLRARLGNVRAELQTKADEIRAKVRAKVKNLRQRDQQLADQIRQIRDRLRGG